jgi:arylsulfatase A-like enzyme
MRRAFLLSAAACAAAFLLGPPALLGDEPSRPPNVLMIAVDDLNDWIEPLGGHPDAQTPHIARLAARGVTFANAHCQAPLCNPSRCSLMMSLRPGTTGIYGLAPFLRDVEQCKDRETLNQYFRRHGYETLTAGKIYHGGYGRNDREWDRIGPGSGPGVKPPEKLVPPTPDGNHPLMDWGVFPHQDEEKGDYQVASWCVKQFDELPEDKPFFMTCGFFLPHVPCHAPPAWWDRFDHEALHLPASGEADRADCSPFSWYLHWKLPEPRLSWLQEHDQQRNLVHAYLACTTFADAQVGRVLDALEASGRAENTVVCLWSDHGFHLGEKAITGKNTLWERSARVPLIFAGPGVPTGERSNSPAELLDVYPTLADLAGLPTPKGLEGVSLRPQIDDPTDVRERPAITDHNPGNQSIRGARYRLIRYADGSEELYDLKTDPQEFDNLIGDPAHAKAADRLRAYVREEMAGLAPGSKHRVLERQPDGWYWQGERIDPDSPPMDISPHTSADLPRVGARP